jgi:TRAP-type C4-dicarboxylate transport system permease small subunit
MADSERPSERKRIEELIFIRIPTVLSGVLFMAAAVINIANVIGRYVFSVPVFWAEEILTFIVIWGVFLLAGAITYRGAHINMDLLYSNFSPFWKRLVNIVIVLSLIGCSLFTAVQSWKVIALHIRNHAVTGGTDIPLVYPHTALLFGMIFMAAAAIVRFRAYVTGNFD